MSSPPFLGIGRAPFVGRSRELAVLANSLEEARAAHGGIVLLAGEPGIGKTRLLEEFPKPTLAAGVTVLRGGSSQAQGMPPYLMPSTGVVGTASQRIRSARPRSTNHSRSRMVALVPGR